MSIPHDDPPRTEEQPLPPAHVLGSEGALCRSCGSPLAVDQRYCLECGRRRGEERVPFTALAGVAPVTAPPADVVAVEPAPIRPGRTVPPWAGPAVAGAVGLAFGIGILIGVASSDEPAPRPVAAAKAPVVNVTVPGGGAATGGATSPVAFTADWPEGQEGYTVALTTLTKDETTPEQVTAAKTEASGKGASDVGALDSDEYVSLDPGEYVVYSGVFDTRKQAARALKDVRGEYPDARVVKVSAEESAAASTSEKGKGDTQSKAELERKQNLSPEEFQKQSKKADKVTSEGKPPPVDKSKPAGGGGEAKEFG